jgi:phosphohistidine phosphatase SixA
MQRPFFLVGSLVAFVFGLAGVMPVIAQGVGASLSPGGGVLLRHALAPGVGDPELLDLNDCQTQRNLSEEGRAQARRIGEFFQLQGVPVNMVWSSQWCRTRETADLAFPGKRVDQAAFNSFFGEPDAAPAQTREARALLDAWRGDGLLVVVTHQVNITALTGVVPASGEAVVLYRVAGEWVLAGRIDP